jgi:hypothetical protein
VFLPGGLPHAFLGVTDLTTRVLVLLIPGGLDEIFTETDPEQLETILKSRGVTAIGPSLSI